MVGGSTPERGVPDGEPRARAAMGPAEGGAEDDVDVQLNQQEADYWQERLAQEVRGWRRVTRRGRLGEQRLQCGRAI